MAEPTSQTLSLGLIEAFAVFDNSVDVIPTSQTLSLGLIEAGKVGGLLFYFGSLPRR